MIFILLSFTKNFVSGPQRKASKSDWHSVPPGMKSLTMSAISMIHFKILGMLGTVLLSNLPIQDRDQNQEWALLAEAAQNSPRSLWRRFRKTSPPHLSLHAASIAPFLAKELALPNWHMPKATFLSGMCVCVLLPLNTNGEQDLALWSGSYGV